MSPDPAEFGWWLASRAAGVVALLCITVSVGVGLAMAGRLKPSLARTLLRIHQQTALVGLVAIAVHAITLLGDKFLKPSIGDIALPFTSAHEPLWTGLGVTGGWLAAILGLSYWARHRIGAALWRKLHRATILVYVLTVAHVLGAGTDASEPWMRALLLVTGVPILFLLLMRVLPPRPANAFRRFRVAGVHPESSTVTSFELVPADRKPVVAHAPGQFVAIRVDLDGERQVRSYSLSCSPRTNSCRISVKREPGGRVSEHLHARLAVGDVVEIGAPAGRFVLGGDSNERPLVLISAGIGVTPVFAMLEALAEQRSTREVWWIHGSRNGAEHALRAEARGHVALLDHGHSHVRYSRPLAEDRLGRDYDEPGRISGAAIIALGVPADADFRLCGPTRFVADVIAGLVEHGVARERIDSESFGGPPAPGAMPFTAAGTGIAVNGGAAIAGVGTLAPGASASLRPADGPAVSFSRSGVTTAWDSSFACLLDLAEASAVPASSGCRIGACHGWRAKILSGNVRHDPEPLEPPAPGSALLCCAVPVGDVVLDA
jgi:ferredoxin-NADP reductase/ferredoxin/DMSO/TMAO reductase YedYZ heme-binding membrane subunit